MQWFSVRDFFVKRSSFFKFENKPMKLFSLLISAAFYIPLLNSNFLIRQVIFHSSIVVVWKWWFFGITMCHFYRKKFKRLFIVGLKIFIVTHFDKVVNLNLQIGLGVIKKFKFLFETFLISGMMIYFVEN